MEVGTNWVEAIREQWAVEIVSNAGCSREMYEVNLISTFTGAGFKNKVESIYGSCRRVYDVDLKKVIEEWVSTFDE